MRGSRGVFSAVLALFLALSALPARAASGDVAIYQKEASSFDGSVSHMASDGGTMILFFGGWEYRTWSREAGLSELRAFDEKGLSADGGYPALVGAASGADGAHVLTFESGEEQGLCEARLRRASLSDAGELALDGGVPLDASLFTPEEDTEAALTPRCAIVEGDFFACAVGERTLLVFGRADGSGSAYEIAPDVDGARIESACACGDGRALAVVYSDAEKEAALYGVELSTGKSKRLFLAGTNGISPTGIAYDQDGGLFYYVYGGKLYRMEGFEPKTAQAVNSVQLGGSQGLTAYLAGDGFYLCAGADGAVCRNVDPDARAAVTLNILSSGNQSVEGAYGAFLAAHPDADVSFVKGA